MGLNISQQPSIMRLLWDEAGFKVGQMIAIQTQFAKMSYASKIRGGSVSSSRMGSSNQPADDLLFTSTELEVDCGEVSQHLTGWLRY
jgi:hypothetical protein